MAWGQLARKALCGDSEPSQYHKASQQAGILTGLDGEGGVFSKRAPWLAKGKPQGNTPFPPLL